MALRLNKPKVFLSHSKADLPFVDHVYDDLRKCQIDPWKDDIEIRTGKPWLDAIFEDGIPTCDSVFVYLTEISVESNMVKKEIDASILQQLKDRHVAFLPYVNDEPLRARLRPDIQTLQVPIFNEANYNDVFPRLVAEVWRSFMERTIHVAVQEEQNKRLKAELELEKLAKNAQGSAFSLVEETDFKYIWNSLNIQIPMIISENVTNDKTSQLVEVATYKLHLNVATLVAQLPVIEPSDYSDWSVKRFLAERASQKLQTPDQVEDNRRRFTVKKLPDLKDKLLMFGLLQSIYEPPPQRQETKFPMMSIARHPNYRHCYTEKMFRFRYWLVYNHLLPETVKFGEAFEQLSMNELE